MLCVPEGMPELGAFGSSVETDVYFCRKYVVPTNGHVGISLSRLPFLPLFTERGVAVRPPSAQTFLQESGVPAVLARYLVKKGERSAESVLDACVEGTFGELETPEKPMEGNRAATSPDATAIRIQSISIEGFRAYRRRAEFSFGEDLTVLFGPNGFGKTSVFDAIDFAFTGEIGRLQARSEGRFRRVAAHLDSENGESGVGLAVEIDGDPHYLVRRVAERKSPQLDGISMGRKAALERLTGWRGSGADRIENMISLFRATHLFSQEHQELARDFQPECRLSSEVVARLLAHEDYQAARIKVSDVCDLARKEVRGLDRDLEEATRQIEVETEELESLGRALVAESPNRDLSALLDAIVERVKAAGIEIASVEPSIETIRSWRTALETRSSNLERRREKLRACAGLLDELPRRRKELERAEANLENIEPKVAVVTKQTSEARKAFRARTSAVHRLEQRLKYLIQRQDSLAWVERNKQLHATLVAEVASKSEALAEKTDDLDAWRDREKSLLAAMNEKETRRASASRALSETRSEIGQGRTILEGIEGWQVRTKRLEEIGEEQEQSRRSTLDARRSEERFRVALQLALDEDTRLSAEIVAIEAKRGELSEVIESLEDHIEGGVCPTCGEDHGSRRELLARIAAHLGREVATDERVARDEVRKRVEELRSSIVDVQGRREKVAGQQAELAEERDVREADVEAFRNSMNDFGVLAGQDADAVRTAVARQCALLERQQEKWMGEIARVAEESEAARQEWQKATSSIQRLQEGASELKNEFEDVSRRLARLLEDRRSQGDVGLESPREMVREQRRSTETETASSRQLLDRERDGYRSDEESLRAIEAEQASMERESAALVTEIARLGEECQRIEKLLRDSEVDPGEQREEVLGRAQLLAKEASVVKQLIEDVAGAEMVIDAATTRAAYRRLQSTLVARRTAVSQLRSRREAHAQWLEYFRRISALVVAEQDKAVSRFTGEYGPRASIIQRRLRSVYGFDDVQIHSEGPKILVRVPRDGKLLRPTDYFSQSQQQTLLLGLFLTTCVSQNWSGLAPVFLDDPITHFDDLNIFAFLDLIDGLLNDHSAGKRQFVVSTCDQKFLELAREKFAYRGESVKCYSFLGIGEDGPIVRVG